MTKKNLYELHWMKKNIKALEERLAELRTYAEKITTQLSKSPGSKNTSHDKLGDVVTQIVELQNEINYELGRMYAKEKEILKAIEKLPQREACLIRLRYIESLSWERICVEMNYSWRQIHRIHGDALKMLA